MIFFNFQDCGQQEEYFNLTNSELIQVYTLPYKVASENYLKAFQYKISNAIIYDNSKLKKIGICESNLCSFCQIEKDSIEHMIFSCKKNKPFWLEVSKMIKTITDEYLSTNVRTLWLGELEQLPKNIFLTM